MLNENQINRIASTSSRDMLIDCSAEDAVDRAVVVVAFSRMLQDLPLNIDRRNVLAALESMTSALVLAYQESQRQEEK